MKKTILKGIHRPIGLPAFLCPMGKLRERLSIKRKVTFNENCIYIFDDEDQWDWNKLFGVCFSITGIHQNSARFGWRYNPQIGMIELSTIVYKNGNPVRNAVANIAPNEEVKLEIKFDKFNDEVEVYFFVEDMYVGEALLKPNSFRYYGCGFYFGGNKVAPHKMSIKINKWKNND